MKLHRLELEGFGPFRERQSVDFDAFADDGIFLISGRTGAGKSSVLDGVCYALFGGVPRYDGAERRLRSDHSEPTDATEVALEFSARGERWRVTRSPEYERPKLRGGGTTKEVHRASLERLDGAQWVGVAARPVDVAAELDEIVGLTQQQFLQVVLLAQNRFARFLLARNDERQAVLRSLFGTRTYEQYEKLLDDLRKESERALSAEDETARILLAEGERTARASDLLTDDDADEADASSRLAALVRASERAAYRADAARDEQARAETVLDAALERERALRALRDQQQQRLDARTALRRIDDDAAAIADDRVRLDRARSAEGLRGVLDTADRARTASESADAAVAAARAAWQSLGESAHDAASLRERDDELTAVLAACGEAAQSARDLERAAADHDAAVDEAAAAERELADLDTAREAVPAQLAALDARLAELSGGDARRDAARERRDELVLRHAAALDAERLAEALRGAEEGVLAAGRRLATATNAHTALLERRLASAAGDLSAHLVDGEPCPVCGAAEHPHPAPATSDPVTDAALDAASGAKTAALTADAAATVAARDARTAHAEAAARAGGADAVTLATALREVEVALAEADDHVRTTARLTAERTTLAADDTAAVARRAALVTAAAEARQRAALAAQRVEALRGRVDAARGTFATIDARRDDATRRRARLSELRDAQAESTMRAQVRADAVADRDLRLAEAGETDPAEVRAALLAEAERVRLDERIRVHETEERALKQRLLELELALADADDEPLDLAPATAALAEARAGVTAAAAHAADAVGTTTRLRDLAERADAAHRGIADLAERHALVARLANTVAGRAPNTHRMTLETFVLAAELEEIVTAANLRLDEMSAGRYRLQHTDALAARGAASGLGLAVLDAFTGQARPPQSLSGGETFLASLALALGLAEVVTARAGGIRLDTLFIDEGFGSLDDETLDLAMRALDELRQGGRTVGVISHVAAMREQIPAQLRVGATAQGPSVIRQGAQILA